MFYALGVSCPTLPSFSMVLTWSSVISAHSNLSEVNGGRMTLNRLVMAFSVCCSLDSPTYITSVFSQCVAEYGV